MNLPAEYEDHQSFYEDERDILPTMDTNGRLDVLHYHYLTDLHTRVGHPVFEKDWVKYVDGIMRDQNFNLSTAELVEYIIQDIKDAWSNRILRN